MPERDGTMAVHLSGPQPSAVSEQHAGTPEASVTVRVGRVLLYLHTQPAAERLGRLWEHAAVLALRLPDRPSPQEQDLARRRPTIGWAEPSMIVHTGGIPAGGVKLVEQLPAVLVVTVGDIAFYVHNRRAFADAHEAFQAAADRARVVLPKVDARLAPGSVTRRGLPRRELDGQGAVERARRTLSAVAEVEAGSRVVTAGVEQVLTGLARLHASTGDQAAAALRAAALATGAGIAPGTAAVPTPAPRPGPQQSTPRRRGR